MPAISATPSSAPPKVLVTGANGFVAMWTVRTLLERGYSVRATVRSAQKGEYLKKYFEKYADKFELSIVADITKENAFDEAVVGADAILHMASPVSFGVEDPQELIRPALQGTLGVLDSALKHGKAIKRIVITGSVASIVEERDTPAVFDESHWNEQAPREVEEKGVAAKPTSKYRASKVIAERAAWDFVEKHAKEISWDLAVINPPLIFGPAIHEVSKPEELNWSALEFHKTVASLDMGGKPKEVILSRRACWVDVRDVAEGHVRALETEAAGGKRFIISAGSLCVQEFINVANALNKTGRKLPVGYPDLPTENPPFLLYDASRSKDILGMTYRSVEETTRDTLADYDARGWA
ncbi:NAD(P)-binding protein [Schizophyllum commune Tattone D]|nr:NAD(P)-binding protein [Schizophyllum commune Tattone D]